MPACYDMGVLGCHEHGNDRHFAAFWKTVEEIASMGEPLYPDELPELISGAASNEAARAGNIR